MEKELSEKQLEAKRLYSQIMEIDLTEVTVSYIKYAAPQTDKCLMCNINGIKYVSQSSLDGCASFISIMEKRGGITERDLLHCRRGGNYQYGGALYKMITISTVLRYKNEMLQYLADRNYDTDATILRYKFRVLKDDTVELPEITIDKAALSQSETLYLQRNTLLREDAAERRKEKGREALEKLKNEQQHREQSQEYETLKDLVSKIEAMGWDVTLSLKPV